MSLGDGVLTLQLDSSEVQNLSTDLEFEFHILRDKRGPKNRQGTVIPLDRPENNVVFSIGGTKKKITGTALLFDVGDDVSNGTFATAESNATFRNIGSDPRLSGSDITGFREQKIWLDEYVNNDDLNASWKLYGLEFTEFGGSGDGLNVFPQRVIPRETADSPLAIVVDFTFLVGDRT
jgi:hypothetical protein